MIVSDWQPAIIAPFEQVRIYHPKIMEGDSNSEVRKFTGQTIRVRVATEGPYQDLEVYARQVFGCQAPRILQVHPYDVNRLWPWVLKARVYCGFCEHEVITD